MSKIQVNQIFGTPIIKIENAFQLYSEEKEFINNLEMDKADVCLSISKNLHVLKSQELKRIKNLINQYAHEFIEKIICVSNMFKMTNSWIAQSEKIHEEHDHKNAIFSCVYYVDAEKAEIAFVRHHNFLTRSYFFDLNYHNKNEFNAFNLKFPVTTGDLIIFPGDVLHMGINLSNKKKTVLGANYFIMGEVGKSETITSLTLWQY